jgi:hypothetical protein
MMGFMHTPDFWQQESILLGTSRQEPKIGGLGPMIEIG